MAISKIQDAGVSLTSAALPAGSVLQVVPVSIVSTFSMSSGTTTYTHATNHSLSITTSVANSKILLFCNTPAQLASYSDIANTCFKSSIDSYSAALGELVHANYSEANDGWKQISSLQYLHQPNQVAGTTITYRVYARKRSGSGSFFLPDSWGSTFEYSFVAMEIA